MPVRQERPPVTLLDHLREALALLAVSLFVLGLLSWGSIAAMLQ